MVSLRVPKLKGGALPQSLMSVSGTVRYSLVALGIIAGRRIHLWIDENLKPMTGYDTILSFQALMGGTYTLTVSDLLYMILTVPMVWFMRKLGASSGVFRYIIYGLLIYIAVWEVNELIFGFVFGQEQGSGIPAPSGSLQAPPTTGSALSSVNPDL